MARVRSAARSERWCGEGRQVQPISSRVLRIGLAASAVATGSVVGVRPGMESGR